MPLEIIQQKNQTGNVLVKEGLGWEWKSVVGGLRHMYHDFSVTEIPGAG
jgi:hypothetical protein